VVLLPLALAGLSVFTLVGNCGPDTDHDAGIPTPSVAAVRAPAPAADGGAVRTLVRAAVEHAADDR
jgi:hypothetical protein